MIRRALILLLALSAGPLKSSQALAQTDQKVTIDIDAKDPGSPVNPIWAYFGYDEANYTTLPEAMDLLRTLSETQASPVRVRTHFLFNTGDGSPALKWGSTNVYTEDDEGAPIYDYTILDGIMDATIEAGTYPLFELGFMPKALSVEPEPYENSDPYVLDGGSLYPPRDYEKWADLVSAWAQHAGERYAGTQTNWMWELWNEPDIGYFKGTSEEYSRLFDHTEAALHAVLPEAILGGPAVARPFAPLFTEFLEHCSSGTNAATGETGTRLDMISFHAKGGVAWVDDHVQMDLGNHLDLHRIGFETVLGFEEFERTPIYITEADPDGCAACPSSLARHFDYRNYPAYGAYEMALMKRSLELADQLGTDLRGVLTWAFTFPDTPYFHGYRALTTNGIHLPVLNAFKLLGRLEGERIFADSSGALPLDEMMESGVRGASDIDVLAATEGSTIRVLVWNYHDDLVEAEPANVELKISLPPGFEKGGVLSHERVDDQHGNAYAVWLSQGKPDAPSEDQIAELKAAMNALEFEPTRLVRTVEDSTSISFELPRFGVSLLTLEAATGDEHFSTDDSNTGCSCRSHPSSKSSRPPALSLALIAALLLRLRRSGASKRTRGAVLH